MLPSKEHSGAKRDEEMASLRVTERVTRENIILIGRLFGG